MNNAGKYGYQKPYQFQAGIPSNLRDTTKLPAAGIQPAAEDPIPVTPEIQHKTNLNGGETETTSTESTTKDPSIGEIILTAISWDNLALSTILVLGGLFVALIGDYLLQGRHGIPLLSGLAYALLFSIGINFVRSVVSVKWQTRCAWENSPTVKSYAAQAESFVMGFASVHDKYLSARDPALTLKVTLFLWAVVYLGYTLSIWRLICLAYFGAFILGAVRAFFAPQLTKGYNSLTSGIQEQWKAIGLKRGHGAVLLTISIAILAYMSTWTTRTLIVLLGLMVVRCNLKPNEVDIIANRASDTCGPYVNSARKQAKRLSLAASEFVKRSGQGSGNKTHWK